MSEGAPRHVLLGAASHLVALRRLWAQLEQTMKPALENLPAGIELSYGPEASGRLAARFELSELPGIIGVRAGPSPAIVFVAEVIEDGRRRPVSVAERPVLIRQLGEAVVAGVVGSGDGVIEQLLADGIEQFIAAHAEARLPRMGG